MGNPTVFEYAKEIGMETLALMDKIREWGLPVKNHMATLEPEVLETIQQKLDDEKPKSAKKKVTKKKVAPKAAAGEKATKSAKKVAKKATKVAKKKVSQADAAKPVEEGAEAQPAVSASGVEEASERSDSKVRKVVSKRAAAPPIEEGDGSKPTVIRRRAIDKVVLEMHEAVKATGATLKKRDEEFEGQGEDVAQEAHQGAPLEEGQEGRSQEFPEGEIASSQGGEPPPVESPAPGMPPTLASVRQKRQNIVGRMDLSRVKERPPEGAPHGGGATSFSGPRPPRVGGGARTLRTGFVASEPSFFEAPAEKARRGDEKVARRRGAPQESGAPHAGQVKEQETVEFNVTEYRKREMVFQPKKKKVGLNRESRQTQITTPKASKRVLKIHDRILVGDLAQEMGVKSTEIIKKLMANGVMANINTDMDFDTVAILAPEFGFEAVNVHRTVEDLITETAFGNLEAELVSRPPVVTVMGHVDHGKTTLLDAIRTSDVVEGEAGGITQHIGAYNVTTELGHVVTFIDTPGHAAFTAMRARGAHVTDVVILVVAADDGVMPQTVEAINHAKSAGAPIVVAINKIDKPGANPERIKQQLTEYELIPEEWGGTTVFCPVSAKKKDGIQELLENVLLVSEMLELKANPLRSATGVVIESRRDKGRGNVATLLVQDGTLKVGQIIVAGRTAGKVRNLQNDHGRTMKEAGPGTPIEVLGLEDTPEAGDRFDVCRTEAIAQEIRAKREAEYAAKKESSGPDRSIESLLSKVGGAGAKELRVVLKSDVAGSNEAIIGMLDKLSTDEVRVKVIHSAVGGISESDVMLASAAGGMVIGFHVRPDGEAAAAAKQKGVDIRTYSIIYELSDEVKKLLSGLLDPEIVERVLGRVEVRDTFMVPKIGMIAGCFVVDGKITRDALLRLVRDGRVVYEGKVGSLKRFKDDAKEVATGYECGVGIENFNDLKVGDTIEAYVKDSVRREL